MVSLKIVLKADIWIAIDNNDKSLQKCENNLFYIDGPDVILKTPILGTNFLKQHKVAINYSSTKKCEIMAETKNSNQVIAYSPLLVNNTERLLNFHNVKKINQLGIDQHLFRHTGIIYNDYRDIPKT